MTKNDFISEIATSACIAKKDAKVVFEDFIENIQEALAHDGRITIPGIGSLTVSDRPARAGRNPRTGEKLTIAASKKITFKAAKELKEAV